MDDYDDDEVPLRTSLLSKSVRSLLSFPGSSQDLTVPFPVAQIPFSNLDDLAPPDSALHLLLPGSPDPCVTSIRPPVAPHRRLANPRRLARASILAASAFALVASPLLLLTKRLVCHRERRTARDGTEYDSTTCRDREPVRVGSRRRDRARVSWVFGDRARFGVRDGGQHARARLARLVQRRPGEYDRTGRWGRVRRWRRRSGRQGRKVAGCGRGDERPEWQGREEGAGGRGRLQGRRMEAGGRVRREGEHGRRLCRDQPSGALAGAVSIRCSHVCSPHRAHVLTDTHTCLRRTGAQVAAGESGADQHAFRRLDLARLAPALVSVPEPRREGRDEAVHRRQEHARRQRVKVDQLCRDGRGRHWRKVSRREGVPLLPCCRGIDPCAPYVTSTCAQRQTRQLCRVEWRPGPGSREPQGLRDWPRRDCRL